MIWLGLALGVLLGVIIASVYWFLRPQAIINWRRDAALDLLGNKAYVCPSCGYLLPSEDRERQRIMCPRCSGVEMRWKR